MSEKYLFLADLHLREDDEANLSRWEAFFNSLGPTQCRGLFILGDLFQVWPYTRPCTSLAYLRIIKAINQASIRGIKITIFAGNRDFLLGLHSPFVAEVEMVRESLVVKLGEYCFYLSHGDELCLQDRSYQLWRKVIRSVGVGFLFNLVPPKCQHQLAHWLARKSRQQVARKSTQVLGIAESTYRNLKVEFEGEQRQPDVIIHGHLHHQAEHNFDRPPKPLKVFSLPAEQPILEYDAETEAFSWQVL